MLRCRAGLLTAMFVSALTATAAAQTSYRGVVKVFDPAPGTGSDTFNAIGNALFNDLGQAAFNSGLTGPTTQSSGIWSEGAGPLSLVALIGDTAPGTSGATFSSLSVVAIDNAGNLLLRGDANGRGLWISGDAGLALVARMGQSAPGTGGLHFSQLDQQPAQYNLNGQYAFHAELDGVGIDSSNDGSIWIGDAQGISRVVYDGMVAPGGGGRTFVHLPEFQLGSAGDIVFRGVLEQGQAFGPRFGVWAVRGAGVELVAMGMQQAPGTTELFDTASFAFSSISVNTDGDTAFFGYSDRGRQGIWAESNGVLGLVVFEDNAAPGLDGAVFTEIYSGPHLDDTGRVHFMANVTGGAGNIGYRPGIWSHQGGVLSEVVAHLDTAPGTGGARLFIDPFDGFVSNDLGQVAFVAQLATDPEIGVNLFNRDGIWATDTEGELRLVLRSGDLIDLNHDPLVEELYEVDREIFSSSNDLSSRIQINNAGQILIYSSVFPVIGWFIATPQDLAPGDVTGDGFVGAADLDIILANWGDAVGVRAQASGDLSGDGVVGQADLDLLIAHWGEGTPPDLQIPEPGSLALLGLGGLVLARRPRRGHSRRGPLRR